MRIPVSAHELRLKHFQCTRRTAHAHVGRGEQPLCVQQPGRSFQSATQIILSLIELSGPKFDLAGNHQTRDVSRRALQDLLNRLARSRQVSLVGRNKRFEIIGSRVLLRYFPDGANLRARLIEIAPCNLQRGEPIARRQVCGPCLHQLFQHRTCRIRPAHNRCCHIMIGSLRNLDS